MRVDALQTMRAGDLTVRLILVYACVLVLHSRVVTCVCVCVVSLQYDCDLLMRVVACLK